MVEWLLKVDRSKKRIPRKLSVLRKMLIRNLSDRITSLDLVNNLRVRA